MTTPCQRLLAPLFLSALLAQPAFAADRDTARQHLEDSSAAALRIVEDGPTRIARGFRADPGPGAPAEAALHFLDDVGPALGIDPGAVTWTHRRTAIWHGRTLVRFQQAHRGVPVLGGSAVVKLDRGGQVTLVDASVHTGLELATGPAVTPESAIAAALTALRRPAGVRATAALAVQPDGAGGTLVYRVQLSSAATRGSWMVTVGAHDGDVREVTDLRREAQGYVFMYSPADGDEVEVTLTDLTGDMDVMSGTYALVRSMVVDGEDISDTHLATADDNGDFLHGPQSNSTEDAFVEVNAYHHVTELSHYFEDTHGHEFDGAALVTTNYVNGDGSGYDNAFYTMDISGNQVLCFGQGTFDFGYDAGVIAHEFGHSIIQTTTDMLLDWMIYDEYGANNAPSGIHEGLADYWAGSYQGRSEVSSYIPLGRDLENDHTCPDDLTGESHDDGMIVGAAAWDIYLQVGKEAADDIVYGALLLLSEAPTFAELAEAMLEAAGDLEADGDITADDLAAIEESLTERGMLVCGRSLPIDPDEPFEHELTLFMGLTELDEEWCEMMREMGVNFMPAFQFSLTTPPADEGVLEELELSIDMDRFDGGSFGADELQYTFMIRRGEMVTVDFQTIETPGGYEMETPIPGESDRELDDNPDEIVITLEDEDIELLSDTTYYLTLLHRNCAAADMTLEAEFTLATLPDDDDDDDDDDGCSCRQTGGRRPSAIAAGLGLALIGLALRRRRD